MNNYIRLATRDDQPAIENLLRLMYAEAGMFGVSEERARSAIADVLENGVGIVAMDGDEVVGSVGLFFSQPWYSDTWCLNDRWCFVDPDHRRSTIAKTMLKMSDEVARKLGVPLLMGVFSNKQTLAKVALFGRVLKHVGALFVGGAI